MIVVGAIGFSKRAQSPVGLSSPFPSPCPPPPPPSTTNLSLPYPPFTRLMVIFVHPSLRLDKTINPKVSGYPPVILPEFLSASVIPSRLQSGILVLPESGPSFQRTSLPCMVRCVTPKKEVWLTADG